MKNPLKIVARKFVTFSTRQRDRAVRRLPIPQSFWIKFDLLKTLVKRDLEAKYKGSILGNFWAILNQLAQLLVYTYLFSIVLQIKLNFRGLPANDFTFGLWMFAGLIPWTAFVAGFTGATTSVISQPNLIKKVVFPLGLLPLVPICTALVESSFGIILLITFVAFTAKLIHTSVLLFPIIWIPQLLLTAGLGYLVAGLTVFLRDIPQTITVILNLWFYLTPIVYPSSLIPEGWRFLVFWLNPMTTIVEVYRDLVLVGRMHHWEELGVLWGVSMLTFAIGLFVYRRLRPAFADVV
ncbi:MULTISPECIES: ABC transporter permease [Leptolyngbya]|uniref:Transport permease protein n=2 Tax=Leptolyngbya boryana TaxID=1184 RepID=A0A1Z4JKU2_LEPBY|nr:MULTISPECIES: ABC transporter permease [Leptolyngbya]MCY6493741.1 ABC transporter permease [Leptolyngbya sp. GGD]ULP28506.1 ABC transporter permease [Leptolyngbya boryana IU 594]WNZ46850.1 ABC transporter permease [Leptolyngbya boryana CZ1]BAY57385.1 ABC-2 type transporter [Leptolyngbya boryana NIES-2135]